MVRLTMKKEALFPKKNAEAAYRNQEHSGWLRVHYMLEDEEREAIWDSSVSVDYIRNSLTYMGAKSIVINLC